MTKTLLQKGGVLASSSEQGFHPLDHRAFLELRPNPSPFAIFAAIRACIQAAERRSGISDKVAHQKADGDSSVADISDDKKVREKSCSLRLYYMLHFISDRESSTLSP